jgi:hypothetical protein
LVSKEWTAGEKREPRGGEDESEDAVEVDVGEVYID